MIDLEECEHIQGNIIQERSPCQPGERLDEADNENAAGQIVKTWGKVSKLRHDVPRWWFWWWFLFNIRVRFLVHKQAGQSNCAGEYRSRKYAKQEKLWPFSDYQCEWNTLTEIQKPGNVAQDISHAGQPTCPSIGNRQQLRRWGVHQERSHATL